MEGMFLDEDTVNSILSGSLFPCMHRRSGQTYMGRDFTNAVVCVSVDSRLELHQVDISYLKEI